MTELTLFITLLTILIFLTLAGLVLLADKCLDLAERVRALIHRGSMDAIALWSSVSNSRLDIERRRAELEHNRESSDLALAAQREKLELGRSYAYLRLRSEKARLMAGKEE